MATLSRGSVAPSARRRALALWIVLAAQLMLAMDLMIVVVALPRIQQDLGFSAAGLTWVPNAFGVAFGGLLLLGGRLGDMIGHVRAFRIGLIVFVAASLLGGMAHLPSILIAARVVQGIDAALAAPSVLALVMVMARDEVEQTKDLSLFIAVSAAGASAGLMLGGILTDFLSWRWALLINVPVGALVVIAIGTASGLLQIDQQIGGTVGIAVTTSIYALAAIPERFVSGLSLAFVGGALVALIAAIFAWRGISTDG